MTAHHRAAAGRSCPLPLLLTPSMGSSLACLIAPASSRRLACNDSLADAVTCGFVPVIVVASDSTPATWGAALVWWGCAFLYAFAAITRLGYCNLTHSNGPWFVGVPAPFCALVISTSRLISRSDPRRSGFHFIHRRDEDSLGRLPARIWMRANSPNQVVVSEPQRNTAAGLGSFDRVRFA